MFLQKPTNETIERFLENQRSAPCSYPEVGATRESVPQDYNVDHNRMLIGSGAKDFRAATHAIRKWKMFDMPWVQLCWPDTPIEIGSTVGILVRHFGFWSVNAARIVYVIEEKGDIDKFGFAYGTLDEHTELRRGTLFNRVSPRHRRGLVRLVCVFEAEPFSGAVWVSVKPDGAMAICRGFETGDAAGGYEWQQATQSIGVQLVSAQGFIYHHSIGNPE